MGTYQAKCAINFNTKGELSFNEIYKTAEILELEFYDYQLEHVNNFNSWWLDDIRREFYIDRMYELELNDFDQDNIMLALGYAL